MNASECPSGSALCMQDPPSCLQEVSLYLHYFPAQEAAAGQHALRKSGTNKTHFLQFPANSYGSRARSNCLRTAPASPNGASLSNSKSEIHLFHYFHQPSNPCHPPHGCRPSVPIDKKGNKRQTGSILLCSGSFHSHNMNRTDCKILIFLGSKDRMKEEGPTTLQISTLLQALNAQTSFR